MGLCVRPVLFYQSSLYSYHKSHQYTMNRYYIALGTFQSQLWLQVTDWGHHKTVFEIKLLFWAPVSPPLQKMLFPVQRPGDFIIAEWRTFFFDFAHIFFFFFGSRFHHFLTPPPPKKNGKKKKDFAAARLATISATRYTENKLFFKGGLRRVHTFVNYAPRNISVHSSGI